MDAISHVNRVTLRKSTSCKEEADSRAFWADALLVSSDFCRSVSGACLYLLMASVIFLAVARERLVLILSRIQEEFH